MKPASLRSRTGIAVGVIIVMCLFSCLLLSGRPVVKDASETLVMALNLQRHGVMSSDVAPPYRPSMMREPLPVLVGAAAISVVDAVAGEASPRAYFSGERVRYLKLQNLFWLAVLMAAAAMAVRHFDNNIAWEIAAMLCVALPFTFLVPRALATSIGVDSLYTDLDGAALLTAASTALAIGFQRRNLRVLLLAGLLFGSAILTKAATLYVFPGVLAAVAVLAWRGSGWSLRQAAATELALLAPVVLLACGWMTRNYLDTGYFQLAERGGPIVLYRGMLDGMTREQYAGSFFAWAAWPLQPIVGRLTGFNDADLKVGGRLQELQMWLPGTDAVRDQRTEDEARPEDALTWYRQSRAVYEAAERQLAASGDRYPAGGADALTRREGERLILERPFMNAALVLPLIWRSAMVTLPLLIIALLYALRQRRPDLALLVLPAFGMVLFYALLTHYAPRYTWVPRPLATVGIILVAAHFWTRRSKVPDQNP